MAEMILKNMLDSLPGIFYMMNRRGYFIQWNQQFEHVSGYSAKELAGIHALELFQGSDKRKLAASVAEVFRKGSSHVEANFISKKGESIPYYFTGKAVQTDGVTHLMGMGIDISDRKKSEQIQQVLYNISNAVTTTSDLEELLEIIHEQLGLLVDATNFYIAFYDEQSDMLNSPYTKDQNDGVTSWPAASSITGYVINTNKPLLATKTEISEMIRSGEIEMIGIPSESWLGVPLFADGKSIGALVVQSYDNPQAYKAEDLQILEFISAQISFSIQRKQADVSLRESEERFRKLTEVATDAIISIDSQGRIILFNLAAERIFGYTTKEIHLQTIDLLIPEKYGKVFMKGIKRYFDTGVSTILGQIFEFKGRRKGGEIFPLELSLSEVNIESEITFIGIIRDISYRKEVETQLERFTNALKESNITKDKFFSIIAHDLKSPFNAILGLTNALIEDYKNLDEKRIESLLNTIKISSERAFELLENLLVWANAQTGQIDYKPQPLNLKGLIDESVALLDGPAANKGIRIDSEVNAECTVMADQQMILTVLRNLTSNAVKFTPFGGRIVVEVNPGQDFCEISVRDTGIGISTKDMEKLFRIDSKHSTRGTADEKGTGLGLILCKEFIEKHGGKIWVESEEGRGSTFRFTLPVGSWQ